jgi:MYXO-CTERM domain-containing protein
LGGSAEWGGGGGGENIGVAQEADTLCCCSTAPDGTLNCQQRTECGPYTTSTPGACDSTPTTGDGGCAVSGVGHGAGGEGAMFVLLLALAALRAMRRRLA